MVNDDHCESLEEAVASLDVSLKPEQLDELNVLSQRLWVVLLEKLTAKAGKIEINIFKYE